MKRDPYKQGQNDGISRMKAVDIAREAMQVAAMEDHVRQEFERIKASYDLDRCVICSHDKSVCEQLKGCIVENDKNFDDEQEALEGFYLQGQIDTIDKIYRYVKRECNPFGKPTIDFESGKKILNYLNQLAEQIIRGR